MPHARFQPRSVGGPERFAVGLMAGTSLDGIDAALVRLRGPARAPSMRLLRFQTLPYPAAIRARLLEAASGQPVTVGELSELSFRLGGLLAESALALCRAARFAPSRLAYMGSHGQTIFHQGRREGRIPPSTLQIGEPAVIAERTGVPVVADFRPADVAAGGEGAPLVPLVDYLFLGDTRLGTVALNLGGIANVTIIRPAAHAEQVLGFDTGPGNLVMDALVRHFTQGRRHYDRDGRMAARGRVLESVVEEILRLAFFRRPPPKSCGREQFGPGFVARYFLSVRGADAADLVRTAAELTARSIAAALRRFVSRPGRFHRLVVSGGGAHNRFLLGRLRELLPDLALHRSDEFGLPVDAKEAIAFAVLADRTMHGLAGNLPRVTGARRPVVLGRITWPGNRKAVRAGRGATP